MNAPLTATRPDQFFRQIIIIVAALVAGQAIFMATAAFLLASGTFAPAMEPEPALLFILLTIAAAGLVASWFVYAPLRRRATEQPTLAAKLAAFQKATIVRFALMEGGGLATGVGFLLTGSSVFVVVFLVVMAAQAMQMPTRERSIEALELSGRERELIYQNEAL